MIRDLTNPNVDPLATPQKKNATILKRGSEKLTPPSVVKQLRTSLVDEQDSSAPKKRPKIDSTLSFSSPNGKYK